jgi:hypothetical protein
VKSDDSLVAVGVRHPGLHGSGAHRIDELASLAGVKEMLAASQGPAPGYDLVERLDLGASESLGQAQTSQAAVLTGNIAPGQADYVAALRHDWRRNRSVISAVVA